MSHDASFAVLFRRSRHAGREPQAQAISESEAQTEKKHEQKELFAVAAVAFTMNFERSFKRQFLKAICGVNDIDNFEDDYRILIQDGDFADLLLLNEKKSEVIAIEFKIDAKLKPHQDFSNENAFFNSVPKPQGYGYQFNNKYAKYKTLKYIILVKNENAERGNLSADFISKKNIQCRLRVWHDLVDVKNEPELPLTEDLLDWLAQNIPEINDRLYADMKMIKFTKEAANMFSILKGISARPLVINRRQLEFDADENEGGCFFGVNIPNKRIEGFDELKKHTDSEPLGWFGYEQPNGEKPRISFWVYCKPETQERIFKLLSDIFAGQNVQFKKAPDGAIAIFPADDQMPDMDWFRFVIEKMKNL